jgi:uncharacterized surface protein with fasciclin (FAS1) repeats
VIAALTLAGACSDDDSTSDSPATPVTTATTAATPATASPEPISTAPTPTAPPTTEAAGPTGPACDRFPPDGEDSLAALAAQPMGTAMASVPRLSALVAAIDAAGLLEALDGPGPLTLLAPVNAAFGAIPAVELDALLTDAAALNSVLLYHAVAGASLSQADLAELGEATSIEGQPLTFTERGRGLSINDGRAMVICANVATANGTIHLINAVLTPPG